MNYHKIEKTSVANGTGIRVVLWVSGCSLHCKGCHNPETWNFDGGPEIGAKEIAEDFRKRKLLDGITLSGGDPFYQQESCLELLSFLPGVNVWIYTGFDYDEISETELAKKANVLVVGKFIEDLKCDGQYFGSSNQKIIRRE